MKLIIAGSRNISFPNDEIIKAIILSKIQITNIKYIISSGAQGVDICGENLAKNLNIPTIIFKPDYIKTPNRLAPLMRNVEMAKHGDILLAFWNGESKGTLHIIRTMKKMKK